MISPNASNPSAIGGVAKSRPLGFCQSDDWTDCAEQVRVAYMLSSGTWIPVLEANMPNNLCHYYEGFVTPHVLG